MKGGFETALVILFGMMFVVMGMDYVHTFMIHNQARLWAENSLAILEHQNRYDEDVLGLMLSHHNLCTVCQLDITTHETIEGRYWVVIHYPVELNHIQFHAQSEIRLLSRPLG